jgi:hypothetical protein
MAARVTKSLWEIITSLPADPSPDGNDLFLLAPQPGTPFVTECSSISLNALRDAMPCPVWSDIPFGDVVYEGDVGAWTVQEADQVTLRRIQPQPDCDTSILSVVLENTVSVGNNNFLTIDPPFDFAVPYLIVPCVLVINGVTEGGLAIKFASDDKISLARYAGVFGDGLSVSAFFQFTLQTV